MFFLSAGTYSHYAVSPIAEGVEFSPFFRRPSRKNDDILGIFLVRRNYVFSAGPKLLLRKIPFWGIFWNTFCSIFLLRGHVFSLCFLGCPRLPESGKNDVFSGIQKCCFFGPRLPDDGPKKSWLSRWLAGYLAGWLTRWLRWLAGYLAIGSVAGWLAIPLLAIWLAGCLALAIWLAIWMAGSLACYLAI